MTEIGMALSNPYQETQKRTPGYVGYDLPGVTSCMMLPDGTTSDQLGEGELLIKSESMFDRYLNKPEATIKEFHEGWFKTGDYVNKNQ